MIEEQVSNKVYLTEEGLKKLESELQDLRHNKRPQISLKVNEAREQGDLKENSEYHAAREQLSLVETKIQQLQYKLAHAQIVNKDDVSTDAIHMFSTVKLKNLKTNSTVEYMLVSQEEVDLSNGKISINSPIGKGLIGNKTGDKVDIQVPAGLLTFEILNVSY